MKSVMVMFFICWSVFFLTSCSEDQGAELKTLENFALNEDVRINACSAPLNLISKRDPRKKVSSFIDVKDSKLAKKLSAELILALTAVPDAAFRMFQAKNGKILVTPDAARYCGFAGALKFQGKTPVFRSCMVYIPFGSGTTTFTKGMEGLTLVTTPDAQAIRHGIVRTMGYMVADTLADDDSFAMLKTELTKSFIYDVVNSDVFSLSAQSNLLGSENVNRIGRNVKNKKKNIFEGVNIKNATIYNFMNYVVGESFDSYYCRFGEGPHFDTKTASRIKKPSDAPLFSYLTDSRKTMEYFFPKTYAAFKLVDGHMRGFASNLPDIDLSKSTSSASLVGEASGFSLGQTVSQRKVELESRINQQAAITRGAHEQWQERKGTYDSSWSDVWGSKKSEMDTAKAVYRSTQYREQALLKELRAVEAEEKRVGANSQTANTRQFQEMDTKVDKFDANAELKKGVQDAAKKYGEVAGQGAGYVGEKAGGLYSEDSGKLGRAFGEGLGDGVGGTLGAVGESATGAIQGVQDKVNGTVQYANDLAVDPAGTLKQTAANKLNDVQEGAANAWNTTKGLATLDGETWDNTMGNAPVVGNLYKTGRNVYNVATDNDAQGAIEDQYKVGVDAAQAAIGAKYVEPLKAKYLDPLKAKYSPTSIAADKLRSKTIGGIADTRQGLILDTYTPDAVKRVGNLKAATKTYNNVAGAAGVVKESYGVLAASSDANADPGLAMEALQTPVLGHPNNGTPSNYTAPQAATPFENSMIQAPSPIASSPVIAAPVVQAAPVIQQAPSQPMQGAVN